MTETSVLISGIEFKIRKLIETNKKLTATNDELLRENGELRKENDELLSINVELTENLNKKIIVNSLGNEKEIEEGRKLIKALVKEIEQCVAILNKR